MSRFWSKPWNRERSVEVWNWEGLIESALSKRGGWRAGLYRRWGLIHNKCYWSIEATRTRCVSCRVGLCSNCVRRPYTRLRKEFLKATANVAKVASIAKGGNFDGKWCATVRSGSTIVTGSARRLAAVLRQLQVVSVLTFIKKIITFE